MTAPTPDGVVVDIISELIAENKELRRLLEQARNIAAALAVEPDGDAWQD